MGVTHGLVQDLAVIYCCAEGYGVEGRSAGGVSEGDVVRCGTGGTQTHQHRALSITSQTAPSCSSHSSGITPVPLKSHIYLRSAQPMTSGLMRRTFLRGDQR